MSEVPPSPTVWMRQRRERSTLTVERIVAESISLMDAEGIDALTMRALGARLQAGATSMYRHVASREELLELAVDQVYAEVQVPHCDCPESWRGSVGTYAQSMRSMVARHGWVAAALPSVGLHYLGPNMLRLRESLFEAFGAAGFPGDEIDTAIACLLSYVVGVSIAEAAWLAKVARSGKTEQEWLTEFRPLLQPALADYPRLATLPVVRGETDVRAARDAKFRYGLDRMLDGLESRLIDSEG
ncbi:TetR/AcrR family transcriptional regulator [Nocardia sp. NPDC004722]